MSKTTQSKSIIFNSEMVNSILEGRKTQTRRELKRQPQFIHMSGCDIMDGNGYIIKCPFGKIGDKLWVKETYTEWLGTELYYAYKADYPNEERTFIEKRVSKRQVDGFSISKNRWRSPAIMPQLASRLTLEITNIRVERLQDISEEDAKAEGIITLDSGLGFMDGRATEGAIMPSAQQAFQELWQSIKGKDSWDENPFVFVIEFKEVSNDK